MRSLIKIFHNRQTVAALALSVFLSVLHFHVLAISPVAYDIDRAKEICDSIPASPIEGIWIYPEDNLTVLVLRDNDPPPGEFEQFDISVVESTDCRLDPGDKIGHLTASAESSKFVLELFTERKGNLLSRPEKFMAELGKGNDFMLLRQSKSSLRFRISSTLTSLLPKTLRLIRIGVSNSNSKSNVEPTPGMLKIYPSYDGNGSSRRSPRYL